MTARSPSSAQAGEPGPDRTCVGAVEDPVDGRAALAVGDQADELVTADDQDQAGGGTG